MLPFSLLEVEALPRQHLQREMLSLFKQMALCPQEIFPKGQVAHCMVTGQAMSMNTWSGEEAPRVSVSIWISPLWLDSLISHKE